MYRLALIYSKIFLISQKHLFWGYSKWRKVKQSTPGLNRSLSSNFWWLKRANHVTFTEECVMCLEKNVFVKKCLQMGFAVVSRTRKASNGKYWLSSKEKLITQRSEKKAMLTVFWNIKGPITVDFLEKRATFNSTPYYQILRQYFTLFIEWPSYKVY